MFRDFIFFAAFSPLPRTTQSCRAAKDRQPIPISNRPRRKLSEPEQRRPITSSPRRRNHRPRPEKQEKIKKNIRITGSDVDVPLVSLDVLVTTKDGQTIPGVKKPGGPRLKRMARRRNFPPSMQTHAPVAAVLLIGMRESPSGACRSIRMTVTHFEHFLYFRPAA